MYKEVKQVILAQMPKANEKFIARVLSNNGEVSYIDLGVSKNIEYAKFPKGAVVVQVWRAPVDYLVADNDFLIKHGKTASNDGKLIMHNEYINGKYIDASDVEHQAFRGDLKQYKKDEKEVGTALQAAKLSLKENGKGAGIIRYSILGFPNFVPARDVDMYLFESISENGYLQTVKGLSKLTENMVLDAKDVNDFSSNFANGASLEERSLSPRGKA